MEKTLENQRLVSQDALLSVLLISRHEKRTLLTWPSSSFRLIYFIPSSVINPRQSSLEIRLRGVWEQRVTEKIWLLLVRYQTSFDRDNERDEKEKAGNVFSLWFAIYCMPFDCFLCISQSRGGILKTANEVWMTQGERERGITRQGLTGMTHLSPEGDDDHEKLQWKRQWVSDRDFRFLSLSFSRCLSPSLSLSLWRADPIDSHLVFIQSKKHDEWESISFFSSFHFLQRISSLSQNVSCKRMHRSTHSNALNNQYVIRESRRKEMMAGKKQGSRWWRRGMREETGKTGGKRGKDYREMMMTEGPGSKSSVELKQEGWGWGKKKSHEEKRENQWRHNMVFLYKGVFCFTKLFSCIHSHSSPSPPTESERLHLCSESLSKHIQEGMERMRKKIYREKCHDKSSGPKIKSAASIVIVTPDPWCLLFLQSFSRWPLLFFSLFSTENPAAFFVIISGVSFELKTLANLLSSQRWERRAWRIDLQILLLLWSCLWVTRKQVKPKASKALFKYSLFQCFHTYVCITTDRTEGKIDKYSSRIEKRVHTFIFVPAEDERKKSTWDELKAFKTSNGQAVLTLVLFIVGFHYILVRFFFICLPLQLQDSRGYNVLQYTLKGGKQACNYNLRLVQHTLPPVLSK